jgi:3-hydroxyacyl-[acyl-carrier-protein] dehydratase
MRLEYFQMVDRIAELDLEARTVRAECLVPDASPVFEGHFPGHPLLPGALMIETIAQTGGWLVLSVLRFQRMPFLVQVKEAKMRAFVVPGQRLTAEARLLHDGSGYAVVTGSISSEGRKVADAEITYRVVPFPNETLRAQMLGTARRIAVPEAFLNG